MTYFDFIFSAKAYREISKLTDKIPMFQHIHPDDRIHLFYTIIFLELSTSMDGQQVFEMLKSGRTLLK